MALALLSGANGHAQASAATTTPATTGAIDTTGASLLVVLSSTDLSVPSVITDSKSNTWVNRTVYSDAGSTVGLKVSYVVNPTVGTSHTFTNTGYNPSIAVLVFSGAATSTPYDVENGQNMGTGTTGTPGSVTPGTDNEVVVTGMATTSADGGFVSIGSSFTMTDDVDPTFATGYPLIAAYKIQTTAGAENPLWTWTSSAGAAGCQATFKAAVAGGAVQPYQPQYGRSPVMAQ